MRTGDVTVAPSTGEQMVTLGFTGLNAQGACAKAAVVGKIKNVRAVKKNADAFKTIFFKERTYTLFPMSGILLTDFFGAGRAFALTSPFAQ
jgi:hypothetical protein